MKNKLFTIFILAFGLLKAQSELSYLSTEVTNDIITFDFQKSKNTVIKFVNENKVLIISQNDYKESFKIKFTLEGKDFGKYDSLIQTLGYQTTKNTNTVSNYQKYKELTLELEYLKTKKNSYLELMQKIDEKSEVYINLWHDKNKIDEQIFQKEKELLIINKKNESYIISLNLKQESTSPENSKVSFVNMPGFEYSFLTIENPKLGISPENYQGYFIKYLFTKGKSYGTIGVYKNISVQSNDPAAFSEMFLVGFGQDFYSRYMGRGNRKFLNLYSGYSLGGIIATNEINHKNIFYISPSIGLELFKNKYFLLDSKVNYFTPFVYNRNLRGLAYNVSLNFVF